PDGWKIIEEGPYGRLYHSGLNIEIIISESFADVVGNSTLILGLAGTANEQAVYYGVPVIAFPGFGPQSTYQRFSEQQKLLKNQLIFLNEQVPSEIAQAVFERLERNGPEKPAKLNTALPEQTDAASYKLMQDIFC
ncbi:hypothetical protein ACFL96_08125, partial [Thermoproteota archaeon]